MQREQGFSMIELMIVVTIVGMLSAIAIPAYLGFTARAKVAEAAQVFGPVQVAVTDYVQQNEAMPADNAALNLGAPATLKGRYVGSTQVANGVITLTFSDAALAGRTITLTPTSSGNRIDWACATTLPNNLRPKYC